MARKRSSKWMSFEEAKEFVRQQGIQSRKQFLDWHDENKPKRISKYPQRVYTKEWDGWNDFLGTNNEFNKTRRNWRSMNEAILWVHRLGLQGGKQAWLDWVKENEDQLPEDIPKRPDIVYKKDWLSWKHWLGDKVAEKVEAQQKARESTIYYIIREQDYANVNNVFTFGIESGGIAGLKDRWKIEKFQVVKMFRFDREHINEVENVLERLSHPYLGEKNVRAVPNIHELCWQLSDYLDVIS
jgi:hypothetical protein